MEKRRSERIGVKIDVRISLESKSCDGFIFNVSREGVYLNVIINTWLSWLYRQFYCPESPGLIYLPGPDSSNLDFLH